MSIDKDPVNRDLWDFTRYRVESNSSKKRKKKRKFLKSRRLAFIPYNGKMIFRRFDTKPSFPDLGGPVPEIKILKKLRQYDFVKRRELLLSLAKQAKKDFEKARCLAEFLQGTFIATNWIESFALPYVSTHPGGFVYVNTTPSLRAARGLLSHCLHSSSTLLGKVFRIECAFRSIDLGRVNAQMISDYPPALSPSVNQNSVNTVKSLVGFYNSWISSMSKNT